MSASVVQLRPQAVCISMLDGLIQADTLRCVQLLRKRNALSAELLKIDRDLQAVAEQIEKNQRITQELQEQA